MQRLVYYLALPILWLISVLPFSVFYLFSDFVAFVVFHLIGYRKKIVLNNLKNAFPEKSNSEVLRIRKKFYRHFCDLFLEMIKTASISEKQLNKRFHVTNPEAFRKLDGLQKSHILMMAHYASYEWTVALPYQGLNLKTYGIYKRIKNRYFDRLIRNIRSKHGTQMLNTREVQRQMVQNRKKGRASSYGMIADQSPKLGRTKYWRNFMGQKVPVFIGSEVLAKKLDLAVGYLQIEKVKRGHYSATLIPITDHPKKVEDYGITDRYFELLEQQIQRRPEFYLWTHKRWKHSKNPQ